MRACPEWDGNGMEITREQVLRFRHHQQRLGGDGAHRGQRFAGYQDR